MFNRRPRRHDALLRIVLVGAVALAFVLVAVAPGRVSGPIRRLANYAADGPDPIWDTVVDGAALREAGRILPDNATYALYYPVADGQLAHDLQGATLLFFTPALPLKHVRDAGWVLSYHAPRLLPEGVHAERTYNLSPRIYLIKVRQS